MNKVGLLIWYFVMVITISWQYYLQATYVLQPPEYHELKEVSGTVVEYPTWYKNAKWQGIYIRDTNNDDGMYVCDIKKYPIITGGSRDYYPTYGECDWLGLQQKTLENSKIKIKSFNYTIYEISINGTMVYSYQDMTTFYRDKFLGRVKFWFYFFIIGVPVMFFVMNWYMNNHLKSSKREDDEA